MKSKSIIFVTENYVSGGANKYIEDIVSAIADEFENIYILGNVEAIKAFNHSRLPFDAFFQSINIFNSSEKVKHLSRFKRGLLKLLLFPVGFFQNFISYISLYFFIISKRPQFVILCNGGYPASNYLIFSLFFIPIKYKPVMTIVSTPTIPKNILSKIFWKSINSIVQTKTHMIIVNSQAIKNDMCIKLNFAEDKINIVRNGVEDIAIEKISKQNKITLGFVSRVESTKGITELLEAYEKLSFKYNNLELLIVGNGLLDFFVQRASEKNSTIKILGHISGDLKYIFEQIDIFTLPSYQEGLPYSVIEACMAKCTVVATNVGGIPEIIEDQVSGLLISPRSSEELFNALSLVIEDASFRKELASNARKSYETLFTYEKMKAQTRVLLR
ncbi:MAG: glycosyltransferase family 4 protein [Bacteriovorax sp.]|nr:glycosyltransferase family 4 protein [Bacteriovorax sp.]